MSEQKVQRLACIVMALFPMLWGVFSLLNDIAGFSDTAQHAVIPLLSMQDTYQTPGLMWRAVHSEIVGYVALVAITAAEGLAGFLALAGVVVMAKNFNTAYSRFAKGKVWALLGALLAVMVWGIGFMVVAGDWFMAWQAKVAPLSTQLGAMVYALPCMMAVAVLMIHKE